METATVIEQAMEGAFMLIKHRGYEPIVDSSAYVAPTAVVVGRVRVGKGSKIMYGAVLDSEGSGIEVGEGTIICENAVLRASTCGDSDHPVFLGDHVFLSPQATLLGCTVESYCYIATGVTVLQGAVIRAGAIVAVGALVHAKTVVPPEFFVPPNTIAVGDPVRIFGPDEKESLVDEIRALGFPKVAFGVDTRGLDRESAMKRITEVRSKEFEAHMDDQVLG